MRRAVGSYPTHNLWEMWICAYARGKILPELRANTAILVGATFMVALGDDKRRPYVS